MCLNKFLHNPTSEKLSKNILEESSSGVFDEPFNGAMLEELFINLTSL